MDIEKHTLFRDRLRWLRGERTQKEMANLLGVPNASYNNWENGREPSYEVLKKIAQFHGVTVDYLIGYENPTHDTVNLSETYGLSDKSLYALRDIQKSAQTEPLSKALITFINTLIESEKIDNSGEVVRITQLTFSDAGMYTLEPPSQMLTTLLNRIVNALNDIIDSLNYLDPIGVDDESSHMREKYCELESKIREAIIAKHANNISQDILNWLSYYYFYAPDFFADANSGQE